MSTARRGQSLRASVVTFVLVTALVVACAMAMLVLLDPRTQAYWGQRLGELLSGARALVGR